MFVADIHQRTRSKSQACEDQCYMERNTEFRGARDILGPRPECIEEDQDIIGSSLVLLERELRFG